MPGGRPPVPSALKILRGNPGKRAMPKNEPKPPMGDVKPPRWLRGKGRSAWRRLAPMLQSMRVLTQADAEALALGCAALGEYVELRAIIKEEGGTYTTTTKMGDLMRRPRPEVAMAADAWRRADHILSKFGMNPSDRTKIQVIAEEESDPFADFLNRKGANA